MADITMSLSFRQTREMLILPTRVYIPSGEEPLEEVDYFKYLGSQVAADGGCEKDVVHRMNEGYKARGALKSLLSNKGLDMKSKKCLYEGVIVPTTLYRTEACDMRTTERMKVNVFEMNCLRIFVGVSRIDRIRNEEVRIGELE